MDEKKGNKTEIDQGHDLQEVSRVWGPMEAEMAKNFLESHGIPCLIRGRTVPFVYPFTVDGMAEFKILVQAKDLDAARDLLASMPEPGEDDPEKSRE